MLLPLQVLLEAPTEDGRVVLANTPAALGASKFDDGCCSVLAVVLFDLADAAATAAVDAKSVGDTAPTLVEVATLTASNAAWTAAAADGLKNGLNKTKLGGRKEGINSPADAAAAAAAMAAAVTLVPLLPLDATFDDGTIEQDEEDAHDVDDDGEDDDWVTLNGGVDDEQFSANELCNCVAIAEDIKVELVELQAAPWADPDESLQWEPFEVKVEIALTELPADEGQDWSLDDLMMDIQSAPGALDPLVALAALLLDPPPPPLPQTAPSFR